MRRAILVMFALLLVPVGYGANLNVDASKKKKPRIIQLEKMKSKLAPGIQNKKYSTEKLKFDSVVHKDAQVSFTTKQPGESVSQIGSKLAPIVSNESKKDLNVINPKITFSAEFEQAYQNALMVELSKRAAAEVEVRRTKKKVSQADINKDAKARRSQAEGFDVQQAGSGEN